MGPTGCIGNAMRITHRGCRHLLSPNLPELPEARDEVGYRRRF